jgi:hypothetical protein
MINFTIGIRRILDKAKGSKRSNFDHAERVNRIAQAIAYRFSNDKIEDMRGIYLKHLKWFFEVHSVSMQHSSYTQYDNWRSVRKVFHSFEKKDWASWEPSLKNGVWTNPKGIQKKTGVGGRKPIY